MVKTPNRQEADHLAFNKHELNLELLRVTIASDQNETQEPKTFGFQAKHPV